MKLFKLGHCDFLFGIYISKHEVTCSISGYLARFLHKDAVNFPVQAGHKLSNRLISLMTNRCNYQTTVLNAHRTQSALERFKLG